MNGLAVAALAFGILWIWWAGSVAAVILGHVALRQVDASDGVQRGRGAALAGVVLGWIGVGSLAVYLVAVLASG